MTMTSKVVPYKLGFGPFAPEVHRTVAPYPFRGVDTDAAIEALEHLFKADVDPGSVACVVLETVQGEGGFIPMPGEFLQRLSALCREHGILYVADEVQSGVGRTGPMWAVEHFGVEPDLVVSGKSLGGGLPLAGVTGRAEIVDAVPPGGLGGTFGGNPVACAAAVAVLDEVATDDFRAKAEALGDRIRARLEDIAAPGARGRRGARARDRCWRSSSSRIRTRAARRPSSRGRTTEIAREQGLVLLSCGLFSNVLRVLVPILAEESDVEEGLELLESSLVQASSAS